MSRRPLRICLAGSGGGHLRQLLDLQEVYGPQDHFFITEDTAFGRSLLAQSRTYFLPHFAWGQLKLRHGTPLHIMMAAVQSFFRSAWIIAKERPDVIISSGAGAMYFAVLWARLLGVRTVVIESFARFKSPSLFGRLAAPLAHDLIVQSELLRRFYPKAHVFDPLRTLDVEPRHKDDLLFATVGATLPFPRLVDVVSRLKTAGGIPERVLIQTGDGSMVAQGETPGLELVESLPFGEVQQLLKRARFVVCHGGTGSIITALKEGCQVIAMPRTVALGEHYDDHQEEVTAALEARSLLLIAHTTEELAQRLTEARERPVRTASLEPQALIGFLKDILSTTAARRGLTIAQAGQATGDLKDGREPGPRSAERPLRICFAGSGGGHIRQLLDLKEIWSTTEHFVVTEKLAVGRTVSQEHRTHFVPHFAWGQVRLGKPLQMVLGATASFFRSAWIIFRERPDIIISEGAGAVFFAVMWGRLTGSCVVIIESFARFQAPSLFTRVAAPLAHHLIVQSAELKAFYPKAHVFDPLRLMADAPPEKADLLFATTGATLPFDRMVEMVAALKASGEITEQVLIQTGSGGVQPAGLDVVEWLPFSEAEAVLRSASIVVCHGGTGSIVTAMREGCHVIAVPRVAALGEHYDDHQLQIVDDFVRRGLIQKANSLEELRAALLACRLRERIMATSDPVELVAFLKRLISLPADRRRRALT